MQSLAKFNKRRAVGCEQTDAQGVREVRGELVLVALVLVALLLVVVGAALVSD